MKRMVKNGDLIDVEPDGTITVAGKPIGGEAKNERELTLIAPYAKSKNYKELKIYIDDETWNKIDSCYYETVKVYFNDGNPLGIFHVLYYYYDTLETFGYVCSATPQYISPSDTWYGKSEREPHGAKLIAGSDSNGKSVSILKANLSFNVILDKTKFDALYKLADKPTQDGTYVLKATVSGGAVTYTWVAQ